MKINLRITILIAFVLSGMAALIYELTWIRPLQFIFGSTTYIVSIIFGVFMAGLALGSWIVSKKIDKIKNIPKTYALLEMGIGLYGILFLSIFSLLPKIYNFLYFLHGNFYLFGIIQFVLIFIILLIPTALMGATFPLVLKYYSRDKIGKSTGEVYAVNNFGAILGSFAAGFILIPLFGIKYSIILAGTINILVASIIISITDKEFTRKILPIILVLFLILVYFGNYNIQQLHSGGFYQTNSEISTMGDVVYYEEGLYATVSVRELTKEKQGYSLFLNGKGQGSTEVLDLRVNFLLSYLPLLIEPEIKNGLVIGLGTGTTSGQLSEFINITTIEIESKVIGATNFFRPFNRDVLENSNHNLIIDDGRNYLLRAKYDYDVIIPEPSDPWQSFSTNLFSKEFFELAKEDLSEDGLFLQWVPIYQMSPEDFKSFYKTFNSVFPNVIVFTNIRSDEDTPVKFETSELIFVGSENRIDISREEFNNNYQLLPEISKKYLDTLRLSSGDEIYHLLFFTSDQMKGYAENVELITDDNLLLEFSTAKNVLNQNPINVLSDINNFIKKDVE